VRPQNWRSTAPALIVVIILLSILYNADAFADYHYASHTGSDEYPYTSWETAADSIQKAIDAASAGDTIYVGSGSWQDWPLNLWNGLALIGRGPDSTVLAAPGYSTYIFPEDSTLIEGFLFEPSTHPDSALALYYLYMENVTVKNNILRHVRRGLIGVYSGTIENNIFEETEIAIDGSFDACSLLVKNNSFRCGRRSAIEGEGKWTIVNNIFHPCLDHLSGFVLGLGMQFSQDSSYIAGNLIYRNDAGDDDSAPQIALANNVVFENNTVVGFPEAPIYTAVEYWNYYDYVLRPRNNVIAGYRFAFTSFTGPNAELSYNCLWNNSLWGQQDTIVGNVFWDPMFIDTSDYHLQAYSPCINAGDPNIFDVDGSRSDIGCYGGPYGASYSYMDLSPKTPDSLSARISGDSLIITWRQNAEADFYRYMVNRETVSGFTPWAGNIVSEPETSLFVDLNWDRQHNYYYRVAAYDNQLNLSPYSEELAVVNVGVFDEQLLTPRISYIEKNYPNPFNEQTIINYHLADLGYQPAEVQLIICDIGGRLVKTLVNQRQYPGDYRISWDGRDEGGESVSSGIYFARLIVSGIELQRAQKIVLLK